MRENGQVVHRNVAHTPFAFLMRPHPGSSRHIALHKGYQRLVIPALPQKVRPEPEKLVDQSPFRVVKPLQGRAYGV